MAGADVAGRQAREAGWWVLAAICLGPFVGLLNTLLFSPLLPSIAAELQVPVALLGQIPALSMISAAALGLVAGPSADQYGHRRLLLLGMGAVVASALTSALAPGFLVLLLGAMFGALSRAIVQPVSLAVADAAFLGAARRRAMSWVVGSVTISPTIGLPLLTTAALLLGWRAAFVAVAVLAVLVVALALRALPRDATAVREPPRIGMVLRAYGPLVRHRPTAGLILSALLWSAGAWGLWTYMGAFLAERHGLNTQQIGWAYMVMGGASFLGSVLASGPIAKLPPRRVLLGTCVLPGVFLASAVLLPVNAVGSVLLAALGSTIVMVGMATSVVLLANETPAGRATTITLNQSALSVGSATGASFGGLLLTLGGFPLLASSIPVFGLAGAAVLWLSRPRPVHAVAVVARAGAE